MRHGEVTVDDYKALSNNPGKDETNATKHQLGSLPKQDTSHEINNLKCSQMSAMGNLEQMAQLLFEHE